MLARVFSNMAFFSTAKYEILSGKYLIPPAPKRPLSSYLLYSIEARKNNEELKKGSVVEGSKLIGEKWKSLPAEEKEKYDKKAAELRKQYEVAKAQYDAKYKDPFKKTDYRSLLMKEFYSKNKFPSIGEGAKAFQEFSKSLTEDEIAKYKKLAEDSQKEKQKITQLYQIPQLKYKDVNALIREMRKQDPNLPKKSELKESELKKIQKAYESYRQEHQAELKAFAASFHIKMPDLAKMLNKLKSQDQKINQEGQRLKDLEKEQRQKATEQHRREKQKLAEEKAKIKKKYERQFQSQIKKLEKNVQKKKKGVARVNVKFQSKLLENKRKATEIQLANKAKKQLGKKVKQNEQGKKEQQTKENKQGSEQNKSSQESDKTNKTSKAKTQGKTGGAKRGAAKKSKETKQTKVSQASGDKKDSQDTKDNDSKNTKSSNDKEPKDAKQSKQSKEDKQEKQSQKSG